MGISRVAVVLVQTFGAVLCRRSFDVVLCYVANVSLVYDVQEMCEVGL